MKARSIAIVVLLFAASLPCRAAIAYVSASHTVCTQSSSSTDSQTCTLKGATTAGNDVIVGIAWLNTSSTVATVRGSSPNSYFFLYGADCNGANECVATLLCHQCASQTAITTTMSAATKFVTTVEEYSGVQAIGITGAQSAISANPGLTITTGDANDWIVCAAANLGNAGMPAPGLGNLRDAGSTGTSSGDISGAMVDNNGSSAGSLGCTGTITSGTWAATGVELRSTAPKTYIWPDCDSTHPCVVHHIDSVSDGTASGETLQDFKFPMVPSSPGNLLIFTATHVSTKSITVSDNNGGSWQRAAATTNVADGEETELFYICGATPGTKLVTIHLSQAAVHDEPLQFSYNEVSGIAPASCLDGTATGANGLTGALQPGAITTSANGDLVYNFGEETYAYPEQDGFIGWVMPDDNSALLMANNYDKFASQVSVRTIAGTYNPTLYVNADLNHRNWNSVAAAFKASSGAGTQPTGIHVTRILHFVGSLAAPQWLPFPSTGNAIVISTSNPSSDGWEMANLTDNFGHTYTRTPFSDAATDPQIFSTCLGSSAGDRDLAIDWTPGSVNNHLLIYDIAGAVSTGSSTGCVGATVNTQTGNQPSMANANITGDPVITPSAANSLVIATSYLGTGPPSATLTPNAVFNSIWATGMIDSSSWDTGDPYAYLYTTSTSPVSFNWQMANAGEVPNGGTYYDGAAIEILGAAGAPGFGPPSGYQPGSITVQAGATTGNTTTIEVVGINGFSGTVNLSCSITPVAASFPPTCSFSPSSLTLSGTTVQSSTLSISTTASTSADNRRAWRLWRETGGTTFALVLIVTILPRRRKWLATWMVLMLIAALGVEGCGSSGGSSNGGGSGNAGTTPGTYSITVTGTSGNISATIATVSLTVR